MDSPFMSRTARDLAEAGLRIARFEFPYMAARRRGSKRGYPDREPVLRQSWLDAISHFGGGKRVVIGGKSLGGRIASMVADEAQVRGVVCLGYPFHPPGRPDRLRTAPPGDPANARPDRARHPRSLRNARGSSGIPTLRGRSHLMDRGRRPFLEAAGALEDQDGSREFAGGMRGVRAFAANPTGPK